MVASTALQEQLRDLRAAGDARLLDDRLLSEIGQAFERHPVAAGLAHALLQELKSLSPDAATVAAAALFPLLETGAFDIEQIPVQAPAEALELLRQLQQIRQVGRDNLPQNEQADAEGLRRLLLALIGDVRVVLVALAWQVVRLNHPADVHAPSRQIAHETRLIHAPLANRLGLWQLKWQLEDLAFRHLEPDTYRRIARLVNERRTERERFIGAFMERLRGVLQENGITGDVAGRAKHIYSIWRKMQRKGLDFHELFDIRAVRVLVNSVPECYSVLGLVHTHWTPVPGEFDDYITQPKSNLYQSLHTAVSGPGGRVVEVQIRTFDMHRHAELGVAAHWRYKEGGPRDEAFDRRIQVMRQLMDAGEDALDDASLLENFQNLTSEERVYALTPKGEVIDLSAGATVLDFAYHIHTEIGHRCKGARVNGRIVPLTTALSNGDRVEILTGKQAQPSRDWLSPHLGYLRTGRARAKVRVWFKKAHHDENRAAGQAALEAELERLGLKDADLGKATLRFNLKTTEDLYVAIGCGDLTAVQVGQLLAREAGELDPARWLVRRRPADARARRPDDVTIEGVGHLLHQMARCCQPLPGDPIAGYITQGRGVSIHRADCAQFRNLSGRHPDRVLEVGWGSHRRDYQADIEIIAWDRKELIRDIGSAIAAQGVSVSSMNAGESDEAQQSLLRMTVRIADFEQLSGLLNRLQTVPGVIQARRVR